MPDKDDEVVNVKLDPEDALRILLDTDLREPPDETNESEVTTAPSRANPANDH